MHLLQPASITKGAADILTALERGKTLVIDSSHSLKVSDLSHLHCQEHAYPSIFFTTSGSTGQPALVRKPLLGLEREAQVLHDCYGLHCGSRIVSLVTPFHIYGFLHSILLPRLSASEVQLIDVRQLDFLQKVPPHIDLLITVPALWNVCKEIFSRSDVDVMVTSTSPFGMQRRTELMSLTDKPRRSLEIFGSTESGGIGFSNAATPDAPFHLFPGIAIRTEGGRTHVRSPFLIPEEECTIHDELEMTSERQFFHLGRSDRIFKYSGKRYSLDATAAHISHLLDAKPVHCLYLPDEKRPQGGYLIAVIAERERLNLKEIAERLAQEKKLPTRPLLFQVEEFPTTATGKIKEPELMRLLQLDK